MFFSTTLYFFFFASFCMAFAFSLRYMKYRDMENRVGLILDLILGYNCSSIQHCIPKTIEIIRSVIIAFSFAECIFFIPFCSQVWGKFFWSSDNSSSFRMKRHEFKSRQLQYLYQNRHKDIPSLCRFIWLNLVIKSCWRLPKVLMKFGVTKSI